MPHDDSPTIWTDIAEGHALIPLSKPAKLGLIGREGEPISYATAVRLTQRGVRHGETRVTLEYVRSAGTLATTKPAVIRFLKTISSPPGSVPPAVTPEDVAKGHLAAERLLHAAGIL